MIILKNNAPFLSFLTEAGATLFAISVVRYFDYLALVSTSPLPSVLTLPTGGRPPPPPLQLQAKVLGVPGYFVNTKGEDDDCSCDALYLHALCYRYWC
jgi:hypothetical protein